MWAQRVEAQRAQKVVLDYIRDMKEFEYVRRDRQKQSHSRQQRDNVNEKKLVENCKYCGIS